MAWGGVDSGVWQSKVSTIQPSRGSLSKAQRDLAGVDTTHERVLLQRLCVDLPRCPMYICKGEVEQIVYYGAKVQVDSEREVI